MQPDEAYLKGLANDLLTKLGNCAVRTAQKYMYYDADQPLRDIGISLPVKFANLRPGIGWAKRAVNTLGSRLNFDGFSNDTFGVNELFSDIDAQRAISSAKDDALIAGCSFMSIANFGGSIRFIPFTALEATGEIDVNTGRLKYGVAVTKWRTYDMTVDQNLWMPVGYVPQDYYLFLPWATVAFINGELMSIEPNNTGRPLLQPFTHHQSANRPFGKSVITNSVRRIIDEVGRLKVRYEVAAEFYSTPQRYINGLAQGAEKDDKLDSQLGKVWTVTKDEDGEKPEIGQLAQMTISQFSDQKKDLARDFCAETGLTLRNLGYETANPTSAESLSAMSDDLLLEAQRCQDELGRQIKDLAITARLVLDANDRTPDQLKNIQPSWKPIFQMDIGAAGDALYKLFEVMPELQGTVTAYKMLGMSVIEAESLASKRKTIPANFVPTEGGEQ